MTPLRPLFLVLALLLLPGAGSGVGEPESRRGARRAHAESLGYQVVELPQ